MPPNKLVIGCDLFLELKLYHLPAADRERLCKKFPFLEIVEVNTDKDLKIRLEDIEVYWGNRITAEWISKLPSLKWVHFGSVGVNRALIPEVAERKILITNSQGVLDAAMVTSAVSLMTALARGLHYCWKLRTEGRLNRRAFDEHFEGIHDLEDEVCLIVGLGEIGKKIASVCGSLGMKVHAIKNDLSSVPQGIDRSYSFNQLREAVQEANYVINLLPLTSKTRNAFDANIFCCMKPSTFFINIGRGETVVEEDLVDVLSQKRIAGAGLDVFAKEPLSPDSPLWKLENIIITPHVAGLSTTYWQRETSLMEENIRRYVQKEPLINIIDMERGY